MTVRGGGVDVVAPVVTATAVIIGDAMRAKAKRVAHQESSSLTSVVVLVRLETFRLFVFPPLWMTLAKIRQLTSPPGRGRGAAPAS
jgi:hypothetical protein